MDDAQNKRRGAKERKGRRDERSRCRFCRANITHIDYKDVGTLKKLVTSQGKMFSRKRSGNCAHCQRMAQRAIKLARQMALMEYVGG